MPATLPSLISRLADILYDVNQVLFRPCADGPQPCLNPVISFQHNNTCIVHKDLRTDHSQAKQKVVRDHSFI